MRVGGLLVSMLLKAAAVLAVAAPWMGCAQVQARPLAYAGLDGDGNAVTLEAALRTMTAHAAISFVGTVTSVHKLDAGVNSLNAGVVEVHFNVEYGLRGVASGESYVLQEWEGLWTAGEQRYKTGARLLMLLHAPSATGLSSPVGGMEGAIPISGSGPRVSAEDPTMANDAQVADLRWLGAKLSRPVKYRTTDARASAAQGQSGLRTQVKLEGASMLNVPEAAGKVAAAVQESSVPTAQASVSTMLQMMRSWETEAADVR